MNTNHHTLIHPSTSFKRLAPNGIEQSRALLALAIKALEGDAKASTERSDLQAVKAKLDLKSASVEMSSKTLFH